MPFYSLHLLETTASTNIDAIEAAQNGAPEWTAIQALRQTSGRGRHGRTWDSPAGNLHVSMVLRPRCPPQAMGHYSLAAALAAHDAISSFMGIGAEVTLKWPNDVLARGRKICGVLLEAAPVNDGIVEWLVAGVGINVAHHPETALYPATSLRAEGHAEISVDDALKALMDALRTRCDGLKLHGFHKLREEWLERAQRGKLSVRLPSETVAGDFSGLDALGNLVLRLADGSERIISAGDVFPDLPRTT